MTRPFNQQFHCPNCNTWNTAETHFGRWIRNNPRLDSRNGYSVVDQDYWVHKFKTFENREFQLIMCVEIKTMWADLSDAQRDTLHIVNQLMRNRRQTPTKDLRYQAGSAPLSAFSVMRKAEVFLRAYGMHVLRFSGLGPDDSKLIEWDGKDIDADILTQIIGFDLDPDTLRPIDLRNHHQKAFQKNHTLPGFGIKTETA